MSREVNPFRTEIGHNIFHQKYAQAQNDTWYTLSKRVVDDVCGTRGGTESPLMSKEDMETLQDFIYKMYFIPGGRYLYYAGRPLKAFNNCFIFKAEEDTREEWARLGHNSYMALMHGGGIGIDYSIFRACGSPLGRTGGTASGPIPLMHSINEIGRNVMQGGSRRSAIYGSINWKHEDAETFLYAKDWDNIKYGDVSVGDLKRDNFNYPAPLDMTNISLNYDNDFLNELGRGSIPEMFRKNIEMGLRNGEPGCSFNFGDKENETGRNACTEVTSADDSDVCNLGSVNMGAIPDLRTFSRAVELGAKFLVCGTIRGTVPFEKVVQIRDKNRRIGLGLMGMHEWMLKKGQKYEMTPELRTWMEVYRNASERSANEHCDRLFLQRPAGYRAIAPTGSIGMLAGTTTGIEPLYSVAYKRRYLDKGTLWKYEYVVDGTAKQLIEQHSIDPSTIETATDLAGDVERRVKFQADVQDYVDMAISSTLNIPAWGSELNNEDTVDMYVNTIAKYAPRLRGITVYPDGARGGQPLERVEYEEALKHEGTVFTEHDICDITGKGGSCGV